MADPTYTLSDQARADGDDILAYIDSRSGTLRAEHVARKIARGLAALAYSPYLGRPVPADGPPLRYNINPWFVLFEPAS
jgi:plasmid stabilization system protein ParE